MNNNSNGGSGWLFVGFLFVIFGLLIASGKINVNMNINLQDPPKKKLAQDTVKMDTVKFKKQQKIYNYQMQQQMSHMDSLLLKKKKKVIKE